MADIYTNESSNLRHSKIALLPDSISSKIGEDLLKRLQFIKPVDAELYSRPILGHQTVASVSCGVQTQVLVIEEVRVGLDLVLAHTVNIDPPAAVLMPAGSPIESCVSSEEFGPEFVVEYMQKNAWREEFRLDKISRLKVYVTDPTVFDANPLVDTASSYTESVPISVANACTQSDPLAVVNACTESEPLAVKNACTESEPFTQCETVGSKTKSAFGTFLAITALVKLQRRIKRKYQDRKNDLINSLGLF